MYTYTYALHMYVHSTTYVHTNVRTYVRKYHGNTYVRTYVVYLASTLYCTSPDTLMPKA